MECWIGKGEQDRGKSWFDSLESVMSNAIKISIWVTYNNLIKCSPIDGWWGNELEITKGQLCRCLVNSVLKCLSLHLIIISKFMALKKLDNH